MLFLWPCVIINRAAFYGRTIFNIGEGMFMRRINFSIVFILLAGVFWGMLGMFTRFLSDSGITDPEKLFVRCGVSFVVIFLYLLCRNRSLLKNLPAGYLDVPRQRHYECRVFLFGLFLYRCPYRCIHCGGFDVYFTGLYHLSFRCFL